MSGSRSGAGAPVLSVGRGGERARIAEMIADHNASNGGDAPKRRMSSEERFEQIVDVAVRLIGRKGYYGMSLQDVASEIGISQTAVIHRVKNKQGLLIAVIERYYDRLDATASYLAQFEPGGAREGELPKIPEALHAVVEQNVGQPELVRVFEMLNAEAMSPEHPAYAYFAKRPQWMRDTYRAYEWQVPDGVDGEFVYMLANAAMYGLEGRWLARPDEIDFLSEWERYSDYLFPLPQWEGCR
ncbi:TetR/AcrR family transcriptional regulator [Bifidobacterium oedipodis]|uniref:TetR family transcriptional regulator n=1 Tax=Bifidobacterium oedipodis TaxID=2675322 RepID=A0A7Y0EPU2_9BIFI|nr:TetR/AcrR family transcriptional regulator [Bifidobacterium sp. DSM 109957]NMM93823.1 TetR family transcriptional regulator [Bifidobacterium sp. DSM 109957]